ncbi:MAG: thymidine kinase [Clostridia bacterium]|nr:thymidine kinase [Clostridia bacterium]
MFRLYFKYGTMGSSKSAQALMCKFNYEQKGMHVLLLKPLLDNRDDNGQAKYVRSRIGLKCKCYVFAPDESITQLFNDLSVKNGNYDCVIVDEAQFCTKPQVEQLKQLTRQVPVLCYGLLTNFKGELFEGSKRIVELADSMSEIKSVCRCGAKSTINARFINGRAVDDGPIVLIGGDESYENLCYWCWQDELNKSKKD